MKYARIINGIAIDVRAESPDGCFTPEIAAEFVEIPDNVQDHWILTGTEWAAPVIPEPVVVEPLIPIISPVEFKLLFTPQERLAIKAARSTDDIIDDFFTILDDTRLTAVNLNLESNKAVMEYLQSKGLITAERKEEIMTGIIK